MGFAILAAMNTSLLLVAHGSRREASNDEVRALTTRLRTAADDRFHQVDCAFLELASPLIPEGLIRLIQGGAERIIVLPYFLAAGRHVTEDIPAEIAEVRADHPEVDIVLNPYLGTADSLPELLLSLIAY